MPAVALPADFVDESNISESGIISDTSGPGVTRYLSTDQRKLADIHIGLKLDGVKRYQDISVDRPDITLHWVHRRAISCWFDDADYDFNYLNNPHIIVKVGVIAI